MSACYYPTEGFSAILDIKLPLKLKDSNRFGSLYNIENMHFGKALYGLGASINLIPLSIFKRLGVGEA